MDPETAAAIATLGSALREKDWPVARREWAWLLVHHPYLNEIHPHIAALLSEEEAMVYPRSDSIH